MNVFFNKKIINSVLILSILFVLPACTASWPDPYAKPEPVVVTPPVIERPEPIEPEPTVVETMPLPTEEIFTPPVVETPAPLSPPPVIEVEPELAAIVSLRGQAADSMSSGEFGLAAATIERAMRIQPRNPVLWLDLAAIRFAQEEFVQCENTAKRALTYAASQRDVSYDAWSLIASSRYARNDPEGGARAEAEAARYQ